MYDEKGSHHLKLIDFGFSKFWEPNTTMALRYGTMAYIAPEVIHKDYTSQCDMWSFGVVVFILLFGYMPFQGDEQQQYQNILAGKYSVKEKYWSKVSREAQDLVRKLIFVDPLKRLNPAQAIEHS